MSSETIISVDVMGGDTGPEPMLAGLNRAAKEDPSLRFLLHGKEDEITALLARKKYLQGKIQIFHTDDVVGMSEKPSKALRTGRNSSLWRALESVKSGDARVALSAGNTGAIVAMSTLVLRKAPAVDRAAIAVHWPAKRPEGYNVVLDMGADVRADVRNLVQFSIMGAEYSRLAFGIARPRVGLLNVGSEEMKGRQALQTARAQLEALTKAEDTGFDFLGFVEGPDILSDRVDVIVTDGFTGNIAMKASEGTAAFIRSALKHAFEHSVWSRFGALFALTSLRRLKARIDPRRVNGGVFLGLNGGVVKSHGSADAVGHASACGLAAKMATDDFSALVARQLAKLDVESISGSTGAESGTK